MFCSFDKAREFVHKLKLSNSKDWIKYCESGEKPIDTPFAPSFAYKDTGWSGIEDWLGNSND